MKQRRARRPLKARPEPDEPVSLSPLDPEEALRALLRVRIESEQEDEQPNQRTDDPA